MGLQLFARGDHPKCESTSTQEIFILITGVDSFRCVVWLVCSGKEEMAAPSPRLPIKLLITILFIIAWAIRADTVLPVRR
jgi:hypothetical protein